MLGEFDVTNSLIQNSPMYMSFNVQSNELILYYLETSIICFINIVLSVLDMINK